MGDENFKELLRSLPVFFIIGRERSGTTLMRTLFDAHPNVSIQVEFHFIWHMYHKYHRKKRWTRQQLERFWQDLTRLPRYNLVTLHRKQLKQSILSLEGDCDYATLCKAVLFHYKSFFDKQEILILGDKCPLYSLHIPYLLKVFPDARFIHLVRDYRDNILSMLRVRIESHVFSALAYRWTYYNQRVRSAIRSSPDQFISMKYEDFVSHPEEKLTDICTFLGIPFVPSMLEFHKKRDAFISVYPRRIVEHIHKSLCQPISAEHIYRWRKKMTEKQVKLADAIAGSEGMRWGYSPQFTGKSRSIKLLFWPGIAYGRLYYTWGAVVSRLPLGIKSRLVFFLARSFGRKWPELKIMQDE